MNDLFNGVEDATDDSHEPLDDQLADEPCGFQVRATQVGRFALFRAHKILILFLAGYGGLALGGVV